MHISLKIPKKENALTADENERSERNQARKWCSEKSQGYLQNLVSDDRLQNIIDTVDTISIMVFVFALHLNHHVTNYFLYQKLFWRYHQTIYQYRQ
jgi:chromatin remodeling complex protein RSC6